ncbi:MULTISPECIES: SDR family NAD(P)-dependent oxidoreductase [Burkholderia]|uniref:3-oxoacyl-ACP reductase n=1 Tax=Burkholderia savannae TaxID=1637837 RepID=A0ABR5TDH8_9BURK|nr:MULTISPECIES: SDR family oxidoreductase [Burkholderia]AOJ68837.1 3-oxoacyl-ACP reductase [Burkholderia savannae]AOJ80815.1 3-oxoacyl-ACP reductase [Burkholderia savannae]AOK47054.1 3-oxoacyl-ACP reductase [Burkholderia sp. MSMB617WGS]KGS08560.1 short chain dehydrogenase family protein [Burkholderia sp. ABCPW 111]KVG45706.1 3-oxoacyl-ACP reductase [Burkholderia sp. MSMB0265]
MSHTIYPSLAGKAVVVTGGGSGIGAAMVEAFVRQRARVFFLDIAQEESSALEATHRRAECPPTFVSCDLRDVGAIGRAFERVVAGAGPVDVLINNAANDNRNTVESVTSSDWDQRLAVNLKHHFFCSQAVTNGMREAGGGSIVNLGSISWHLALKDLSIYMTAKAGIEGLTRGLARDLGPYGIRVNCIVPGAVRTPRQMKLWQSPESEAKIIEGQCLPLRIEPEHVANMALFLASSDSARCSGRAYFVDAGWYGA